MQSILMCKVQPYENVMHIDFVINFNVLYNGNVTMISNIDVAFLPEIY